MTERRAMAAPEIQRRADTLFAYLDKLGEYNESVSLIKQLAELVAALAESQAAASPIDVLASLKAALTNPSTKSKA